MKLQIFAALVLVLSSAFGISAPAADIFSAVPAESLICLRIHNLEYTLGSLDQFAAGLSPAPVAFSMMGRMQLGSALGDPNLSSVNMRGDFAVFGLSGKFNKAPGAEPQFFMLAAVPVTNFKQLAASHAVTKKVDANGILTIGPNNLLMAQAGSFAILGSADDYDQITYVLSHLKSKALDSRLAPEQIEQSTKQQLWIYGDLEKVNQLYGPAVLDGFKKMQTMVAAQAKPGTADATKFLKIYFDAIQAIMNQSKDATVSVNIKPEVINISKTLTAIADSNLGKMLMPGPRGSTLPDLYSYMPADSIATAGGWIDRPFIEQAYPAMLKSLGSIMKDFGPQQQRDLMALVHKSLDAIGDTAAFAFMPAGKSQPPFAFIYLIKVKNADAFKDSVYQQKQQMEKPYVQEFFKSSGVKADYTMKKNAWIYKGIPVDQMIFTETAIDPNSEMARQMQKIYGGKFITNVGVVRDVAVLAGGADANAQFRAAIDKLEAKPAIAPALKNSLALIPDANTAQMVGTINILSVMKMAAALAPVSPIPPQALDEVPSTSSIAFAGHMTKNAITFDVAIPKKHLTEIKSAFELAMQQHGQAALPPQGQTDTNSESNTK
jgi:hypothetical protein